MAGAIVRRTICVESATVSCLSSVSRSCCSNETCSLRRKGDGRAVANAGEILLSDTLTDCWIKLSITKDYGLLYLPNPPPLLFQLSTALPRCSPLEIFLLLKRFKNDFASLCFEFIVFFFSTTNLFPFLSSSLSHK